MERGRLVIGGLSSIRILMIRSELCTVRMNL